MNLSELKGLDLRSPGEWPLLIKVVAIALVCVAVGGGWYYYDIQEKYVRLERVEREEMELRKTFEDKQSKVVNLELYKEQLEEMRQALGAMLRQLPDKAEIADLLTDVSQSGLASGLEFELFQPQAEVPREFYAEKPIRIQVVGTYHEFGEFISSLAAMPRIVTVHDIRITRRKDDDLLRMEAIAKTYRYLDEVTEG
jgi:type IV pilus assembly protein PilO